LGGGGRGFKRLWKKKNQSGWLVTSRDSNQAPPRTDLEQYSYNKANRDDVKRKQCFVLDDHES